MKEKIAQLIFDIYADDIPESFEDKEVSIFVGLVQVMDIILKVCLSKNFNIESP